MEEDYSINVITDKKELLEKYGEDALVVYQLRSPPRHDCNPKNIYE